MPPSGIEGAAEKKCGAESQTMRDSRVYEWTRAREVRC